MILAGYYWCMPYSPIVEKLRALRIARGLTQLQVAEAIGQTKASISQYEGGKRRPTLEALALWADALDYVLIVDLVPDGASSWVDEIAQLQPAEVAALLRLAQAIGRQGPVLSARVAGWVEGIEAAESIDD